MMQRTQDSDAETFTEWTQSALRQLYDSPALGAHPLAELLADDAMSALDRAQNLRRLILDGIGALRPGPGIPADSPDWRTYRILELRYLDGLTPDEAMDALALQKSQFYRDQARAWQALSTRLWHQYQDRQARRSADITSIGDAGTDADGLVGVEAQRLVDQAQWQEVDAGELIEELQVVVSSLARQKGVALTLRGDAVVRVAHASRVPLRQAVLNAASYALELGTGGAMSIETFAEASRMGVLLRRWYECGDAVAPERPNEQASRHRLCENLVSAMGGSFAMHQAGAGLWELRLSWPAARIPALLVIDDNEGFLELYRRYLAGHVWQVFGAKGGTEAREAIVEARPTVILLDVLMPKEDGWDLLVALKSDERTRDIPVIVCSVLKEAPLALSLGASAYLPKPVSEASLVQALLPWTVTSASQGPTR